ncbi:hypothetical protein [Histidinibacterium lentulum]|nr:hypothetical protein [Histidinibacterium lentulum]
MIGMLVTAGAPAPPERAASATGIAPAIGWLGHAPEGRQGRAVFDRTGSRATRFAVATLAGGINLGGLGLLPLAPRRRREVA